MIVAKDASLLPELTAAFAPLVDLSPIIRAVTDVRQAAEAALSWQPDLALVEMTSDLEALRITSEEIRNASPETTVTAVFHPTVFPPDVPESAILIAAIRGGVQDFVRRPVSSRDLEQLFEHRERERRNEQAANGSLVSFISNKGGVGKSTLAVNTAVGVARRHPGRVLLIDASLQMGVCAALLDVRPSTTILDAARERDRLDERFLRELTTPHSSGLSLLAAPLNAVDAIDIDEDVFTRILTLARRCYDYIVVDTFPMFDRTVMVVLDLSDRTYVVLENVVPTILSAVKFLELLGSLGFPQERQRIIVNRYSTRAQNPRIPDIQARLNRDVDWTVPFHHHIQQAANTGQPYMLRASRYFRPGRTLHRLVADIEALHRPLAAGMPSDTVTAASRPVEQESPR